MSVTIFDVAPDLEVTRIRNDVVGANTWVVRSKIKQKNSVPVAITMVIDPGSSWRELERVLRDSVDTPTTLITHGHFDHVLGAHKMEVEGSPIFMHSGDQSHIARARFYLRALSYGNAFEPFQYTCFSKGLNIPDLSVLKVPGHSRGSCAFAFHGLLATGDTVLANSVFSRTVAGFNSEQQLRSVRHLLSLSTLETLVLPGHGDPAQFGDLLLGNPELQAIAADSKLGEGD